ncbi:MAG: hypothetical protein J0M17_09775 [Planctomycetes bacterium]|jgi:hypothetical protein|nr:hypothetical protein [Planctomycetota bacterium]
MSLTIREKEHWKERIEQRISSRIKEIEASEPAHVWDELKRRAEQAAVQDMGIAALYEQAEDVDKRMQELTREQRHLWTQMMAVVRDVHVSQVETQTRLPFEVSNQIATRKEVRFKQLRQEHPKGALIESLRREQEELLDTVWLATSSSQIKELWSKIADELGCELTPFQKQALAITPLNVTPSKE